jgi:hypothetical protein
LNNVSASFISIAMTSINFVNESVKHNFVQIYLHLACQYTYGTKNGIEAELSKDENNTFSLYENNLLLSTGYGL